MKPTDKLVELFEDWNYLLHRDGLSKTIPAIFLDILQLPYRCLRFKILSRLLDEPLPEYQHKIALEIRPFEITDLSEIKRINCPSEAQQCADRLRLGHQGLVALHAGQVIGYAWGSVEVNPEVEQIPIHLEPGDVLCSDVFTDPAYRGKGVQTALSLARFRLFKELGFHRAICYIEVRNAPSLVVWQKKLGAQITGSIDFLRLGPWYRIRCYNN